MRFLELYLITHLPYRYFSEGLKTVEHFGSYVEDLSSRLTHIASEHEEERRALVDIRNTLKNSPGFSKVVSIAVTPINHKSDIWRHVWSVDRSQKFEKFSHEAMMSSTFQMVHKMRDILKDDPDDQEVQTLSLISQLSSSVITGASVYVVFVRPSRVLPAA